MPATTLPRGNILNSFLTGPSLTPVAVAANTTAEQSFTVVGLQVNDQLQVSANSAQTAGIFIANARVPSANTMTIAFGNCTGGSLTPVSGIYAVEINRPEITPLPTNAT